MTGLGSVRPSAGARVTLKLQRSESDSVTYQCSVLQAELRTDGIARVHLPDGHVTFEGLERAPEWLTTLAHGLLRSAWRSSDEAGWPRRVTRWRKG